MNWTKLYGCAKKEKLRIFTKGVFKTISPSRGVFKSISPSFTKKKKRKYYTLTLPPLEFLVIMNACDQKC